MAVTRSMTPQELVVHESITGLITEVRELRTICAAVKAENLTLKEEIAALTYHKSASLAVNGNANANATVAPEVRFTQQLADLLGDNIKDQHAKNDDHAAQLKGLNGRIAELEEGKLKRSADIQGEHYSQLLSQIASLAAKVHNGTPDTHSSVFFYDTIDRTKEALEKQIDELREKLSNAIKQVNNGDSIYHITESFNKRGSAKDPGLSMDLPVDVASRLRQEHLVDDCYRRQGLKDYWLVLNHVVSGLPSKGSENKRYDVDSFRGTYSELWALQNRVVRRLAALDRMVRVRDGLRDEARD